eukprot:CAMPEP_0170827536 /NCGR_PEP_ID=MMETSP0733-20121128/47310_1 /TAXON_ID=186038 /ORGANISM="Fragilariopsis kerguelensis, Strain L26-C5" /LENGTH=688 /DNA_ID=CAMNT_0011191699 /DNA_START=45 /DNA_END=2113 /DNA_ORIENTATION=-
MATSTVFCLPSPSSTISQSPMMYEEFKHQKNPSSSSPSKSKSKAAPSSQAQTPSLPWLVQYWSSSLLQKPGMLMDQMFSCGAVDTTVATTVTPATTTPAKTFDTVKLDESYRINIEKNDTIGSNSIYFDETIAAKATLPKPASPTPIAATPSTSCTPFRKSNHRKSKSLSEKWTQLRSVVASHDDTNSYDYYEDVMMSVSVDDDRHNNASRGLHPISSSSSNCRQSKQESFRNYRKSSIVVDDDEDDSDDDDTNALIQDCDKWNDDDDIRLSSPFHNHENDDEEEDRDDDIDSLNSINTNSYMNLHTCHSFDQYIDTTHYLCATSESEHVKIKGATGATVSPTSSSSPTKKPGSSRTPPRHQHTRTQTPEAYTTTTAPLAKTGGGPLRKSRTPPSPAKSTGADTYTTISLSHSYVHDFESQNQAGVENSELELEEEQQEEVRDLSTSSSHASLSSLIEDLDTKMNGHSLFLDRLANEQLVTPPRTSTTPPPPPNSASLIRHGSPFRMKNNTSVSSHSHSQEEINNNIFGIVDDDEQDEDEDDSLASSSAFRSLIRMQTQNYQLASSLSLSTHDAAEIGVRAAAAAVRIRDASQDLAVFSTPSPTRVMPTSSPPSLVVPLHPHQRIIAPLPLTIVNTHTRRVEKQHRHHIMHNIHVHVNFSNNAVDDDKYEYEYEYEYDESIQLGTHVS